MRLRLSLIAVAIICAKLPGATVTYTLSLNENASGQCAPGNFTLYGSVSKDDNFGLYAWAVDLKAAPDGGPTYTNFINRSPGGYFNVDPNDPDYDPNFEYPQVSAGFVIVRSVQPDRGIFGGQLNIHPGDANVMIGGFGQTGGNMNSYKPPPYRNRVSYQDIGSLGDVLYGTTVPWLPEGSLRLGTGRWLGPILPSFDTTSPDTFASVFTNSDLTTFTSLTTKQFQTIDFCTVVPEPASAALLLGWALMIGRRRGGTRV